MVIWGLWAQIVINVNKLCQLLKTFGVNINVSDSYQCVNSTHLFEAKVQSLVASKSSETLSSKTSLVIISVKFSLTNDSSSQIEEHGQP